MKKNNRVNWEDETNKRLLCGSYNELGEQLRAENPRKYEQDLDLRQAFRTRDTVRRVARRFEQEVVKYFGPSHPFLNKTLVEKLSCVQAMLAHFPDVQPDCPHASAPKYRKEFHRLLKEQCCPFL